MTNSKYAHLNTSQRTMVAAKMANMGVGYRNQPGKISNQQAADMLNVSIRYVKRAKVVQRDGSPELIEAIEAGEMPVSVALTLLKLTRPEQIRAIAEKNQYRTRRVRAKSAVQPTMTTADGTPMHLDKNTVQRLEAKAAAEIILKFVPDSELLILNSHFRRTTASKIATAFFNNKRLSDLK